MSSIAAGLKFTALAVWCLIIAPPQILLLIFHKGKLSYYLPQLWHKGVCLLFGIRFNIAGTPVRSHQTLYVSNHLSYLDIPLIASVLQASFLAKKEVKSWPVFGFLADLQNTAYIERKRSAIGKETSNIDKRLQNGESLIIFPEGTSSDGKEVLPFKSSLFTLVIGPEKDHLYVQPMTLRLDQVNGAPVTTQDARDLYAWHINMDTELPVHLWRFAKTKGANLTLTFHPPLMTKEYEDRKTLAKTCHDNVSKGLEISHAA